ncbi:hypothetical protein ACWOE3_10235 [Enterococcus dispar]|uniref:Uncharacterized protein n=1 Tax=Enterococcus dispar ATCC 51266 TaxID=1139219 RepID=S1NXA9_9ENTE|nr:hypothetical protein [Enterococcus dispar]EOT42763.1 hypothetical protein OMK_01124 [Enterococcus dispar ATCC 51266]EOW84786.1 hypothetical protein I569_00075 [Enterococcus dispar ATCC 51266]
MIKKNTVFLNGRKIGTYEFVQKAGSGHINFNGFDPYEAKLTDDQQVVLEWLKEEYKRTKWSSPFGTVYSTINIHEMFVRMRLTMAQQFQVLAAFAEWGNKTIE